MMRLPYRQERSIWRYPTAAKDQGSPATLLAHVHLMKTKTFAMYMSH